MGQTQRFGMLKRVIQILISYFQKNADQYARQVYANTDNLANEYKLNSNT
jgi:hypothetical protein